MVKIIAAHSARTASFHLEDGWSTSDLWASATHLLWLLVCRCLLGPKKGGPHLSFDGHTYLLSLGICHFSFFWLLTRSLTLDQAFSLDRCLSFIGGPCPIVWVPVVGPSKPFQASIFWSLSRQCSFFGSPATFRVSPTFSLPFQPWGPPKCPGRRKKNMQKEGGGS